MKDNSIAAPRSIHYSRTTNCGSDYGHYSFWEKNTSLSRKPDLTNYENLTWPDFARRISDEYQVSGDVGNTVFFSIKPSWGIFHQSIVNVEFPKILVYVQASSSGHRFQNQQAHFEKKNFPGYNFVLSGGHPHSSAGELTALYSEEQFSFGIGPKKILMGVPQSITYVDKFITHKAICELYGILCIINKFLLAKAINPDKIAKLPAGFHSLMTKHFPWIDIDNKMSLQELSDAVQIPFEPQRVIEPKQVQSKEGFCFWLFNLIDPNADKSYNESWNKILACRAWDSPKELWITQIIQFLFGIKLSDSFLRDIQKLYVIHDPYSDGVIFTERSGFTLEKKVWDRKVAEIVDLWSSVDFNPSDKIERLLWRRAMHLIKGTPNGKRVKLPDGFPEPLPHLASNLGDRMTGGSFCPTFNDKKTENHYATRSGLDPYNHDQKITLDVRRAVRSKLNQLLKEIPYEACDLMMDVCVDQPLAADPERTMLAVITKQGDSLKADVSPKYIRIIDPELINHYEEPHDGPHVTLTGYTEYKVENIGDEFLQKLPKSHMLLEFRGGTPNDSTGSLHLSAGSETTKERLAAFLLFLSAKITIHSEKQVIPHRDLLNLISEYRDFFIQQDVKPRFLYY